MLTAFRRGWVVTFVVGIAALLLVSAAFVVRRGQHETASPGVELPVLSVTDPTATLLPPLPAVSQVEPFPTSAGAPGGSVGTAPPPPILPPYNGQPLHVVVVDPEVVRQVGEATLAASKAELADLAVTLAAHPQSPDDWMRVAHIKRFYHDYTGGRDAYEYLNVIMPNLAVPFANLGILYGYYLKEPERAVPKYERAIALEPGNASFYLEYAGFLRDVVNDAVKAEKTLLAGLLKLPNDASLAASAAALYQSLGNTVKAIAYYELARSAHPPGSAAYVAITRELEKLATPPAP